MEKKIAKIEGKVILAPMHNTTNIAFRILCKRYGAALTSTELLSANAIAKGNKSVMKNAIMDDEIEHPISIQLFSPNTENLIKAAKRVEDKFDFIDLNIGCPSKKILAQGSGGALLRRKNKIGEIVREVSRAIKKPLTVKIRAGFNNASINTTEIAKVCFDNGAYWVTVHGRTVEQGYSGSCDLDIIKRVKNEVGGIIIGNGDVVDGPSALKMFEETGCDYIMVGRAAIGNPFVFKAINTFLKSGEVIEQSKEERIKDFFEYITLTRKYGIFSVKDARIRAQEFTKGLPGGKKVRGRLNKVRSFETIEEILNNFKN